MALMVGNRKNASGEKVTRQLNILNAGVFTTCLST
jgi:hypothetical protein